MMGLEAKDFSDAEGELTKMEADSVPGFDARFRASFFTKDFLEDATGLEGSFGEKRLNELFTDDFFEAWADGMRFALRGFFDSLPEEDELEILRAI